MRARAVEFFFYCTLAACVTACTVLAVDCAEQPHFGDDASEGE